MIYKTQKQHLGATTASQCHASDFVPLPVQLSLKKHGQLLPGGAYVHFVSLAQCTMTKGEHLAVKERTFAYHDKSMSLQQEGAQKVLVHVWAAVPHGGSGHLGCHQSTGG